MGRGILEHVRNSNIYCLDLASLAALLLLVVPICATAPLHCSSLGGQRTLQERAGRGSGGGPPTRT